MPPVQRRPVRRTHLDASVTPIEHALIERAKALDELADMVTECAGPHFDASDDPAIHRFVASQFRELAEELHYW